ncbi:MAG TPA: MFS transporter [Candidatus Eisenbacteria bacterium]|jgi:FSR family fosmidomycin resistance protein-like MFS transporter
MRSPSSPFLTPRLVVLAAGHFTIDAYSSFFLPLLPLLAQRLGLNYAMVGGLTAMASLSSSFSQPLFGVLSDRMRRPWFVALGPMIAAVFMASIGLAPRYDALVALLVLGGVGVAMFHPQTASLAGASSPHRGMAMSFWVTGGTLGWALGPAYATAIVHQFGLARTWLAAIPGLVMCALLFTWFARVAPRSAVRRERASLAELKPVARPLAMLYFTVVSRSAVSSGFATFLPLWVHARGGSVTQGGWLTTIYLTLGALGGFAGGWFADRVGGRRVVIASFALAAPCYVLFFTLPQPAGIVALVAGYCVLQASLPVNVVLGQELSPRHASVISSLLMGAAWGLGALLIYPIGAVADHFGLDRALMLLSSLILVGLLCATRIARRPAAVAAPASA